MIAERTSRLVRAAGRLLALAWLVVAVWRFLVAVLPDNDGFGEAQRHYLGLLLLQALCALVAAGATLGLGESLVDGQRRGRAPLLTLLVLAIGGFVLVFTKSDLYAWGAYEN